MTHTALVTGFCFNTGQITTKRINLHTGSRSEAERIKNNFSNYFSIPMAIHEIVIEGEDKNQAA